MKKDVSVLITCHNEGAYIASAIASVINQTAFARIAKIVVVDDGSRDESPDRVRAEAARCPLIDLVVRPEPGGVSAARNTGLARIDTEWVAFLDGDDLWAPDKLARQFAAVAADLGAGLVYGEFIEFVRDGEPGAHIRPRVLNGAGPDILRRYFLFDAPVMPSSILMRTRLVREIGGFDEALRLFEDTDFVLRAAAAGARLHCVAAPLIRKRIRANSLSAALDGWERAMTAGTAAAIARHPELAPLACRRMSYRLAKIARARFGAGQERLGWDGLKRSLRLNPFNARAYAYAAFAMLGPAARAGALKVVRAALAPRTLRWTLAASLVLLPAACTMTPRGLFEFKYPDGQLFSGVVRHIRHQALTPAHHG
ncbi:MAG: glycosyltransferase family 2 protein [Hyphomonadaceae bacterium]